MVAATLFRRVCAGLLAIGLMSGCTHTVVPPTGVESPTQIFLLDHGRTSSVVLPHSEGLVRYAYGEWAWYARNRTGVVRGSGALLRDSRGALGRRRFDAEPETAAVRAAVAVPIEAVWAIEVPADSARTLAAELDALFQRRAEHAVANPRVVLRLVPHPDAYSVAHNSNHMTASWLRRMECRVDMNGPWSHWQVENPSIP